MSTAIAIGFATTGVTLLVTVVLFATDRLLTRSREKRELRRLLVARVLDTFDQSTRLLLRPAVAQLWTNGELEFTLLTPRMLLDLSKQDRVIALWMQRQVQLMQLAVRKEAKVRIRAASAEALLLWHHGERDLQWFTTQLKADPQQQPFKVPAITKAKQLGRDSWAWAQVFAVLAGVAFLIRQATK